MRLDLLDLRFAGRFGFAEPLCALNERRDTDPTAFPPTRPTLRCTSSTGTPSLSTSTGLGVYCRSRRQVRSLRSGSRWPTLGTQRGETATRPRQAFLPRTHAARPGHARQRHSTYRIESECSPTASTSITGEYVPSVDRSRWERTSSIRRPSDRPTAASMPPVKPADGKDRADSSPDHRQAILRQFVEFCLHRRVHAVCEVLRGLVGFGTHGREDRGSKLRR